MDRYKIIRYFAYTIEILILYMVQETPGLLPEIGGARPVLLIPAAISIAMFESELAGIAFGLLCGLFLDIGMGGVLGFHGLLLAAACYGVGLLTADLIQTNFLTSLLLAAGAVAGILFLQWVFSICSTATSTADMRWSHGTCRAWRIPSVQCRSVTHSTALWPSRSAQKRNSRRAGV